MDHTISIIIPTLNEEDNIKRFLETYCKLNPRADELIIVDGYSKDRTLEIIKEFMKRCKEIKLFQVKGPPSIARNYGKKMANGEYIIFMDADWRIYTQNIFQRIYEDIKKYKVDIIDYIYSIGNIKTPRYNELKGINKYFYLKDEPERKSGFMVIRKEICPDFKQIGYGEDRLFYEEIMNLKRSKIDLPDRVLVSRYGEFTFKKYIKRYLWYGRTLCRYLSYKPNEIIKYIFYFIPGVAYLRGLLTGLKNFDLEPLAPLIIGILEQIASIIMLAGVITSKLNKNLGRE